MLRESMSWRGDPALIVAAFDQDQVHRAFVEQIERARPDWHVFAACEGSDLALFFPVVGENPRAALAICAECPVRVECLDEALDDPELDHGVRGGMTARARTRLRRERQSGGAAA